MARKGSYLYNVYVDCGIVLQDGIKWHLKKEFFQSYSINEALEYKEMLEKKFIDVVLDKIELGKYKFSPVVDR